jgi:DNA-binding CsgD family transcriptional regulator
MRKRFARREDLGLTPAEFRILRRLDTPQRIQAYLNAIPQNFEPDGQTALSVREVLRQRRSHCIEGAMVAAAALWVHGERPLLLDLSAVNDYDHVVALFRRNGCWGAISKTNHYALRYRDPVYRTLRELALSYFHEYANRRGHKTLRRYSRPLDLRTLDPRIWATSGKNCWEVAERLEASPHYPLLTARQVRTLRRRDDVERRAFDVRHYPPPLHVRRRWAEKAALKRAWRARRKLAR